MYRRRLFQGNSRRKALDEIRKIYIFLRRSDFEISAKSRPLFLILSYCSKNVFARFANFPLNVDEFFVGISRTVSAFFDDGDLQRCLPTYAWRTCKPKFLT